MNNEKGNDFKIGEMFFLKGDSNVKNPCHYILRAIVPTDPKDMEKNYALLERVDRNDRENQKWGGKAYYFAVKNLHAEVDTIEWDYSHNGACKDFNEALTMFYTLCGAHDLVELDQRFDDCVAQLKDYCDYQYSNDRFDYNPEFGIFTQDGLNCIHPVCFFEDDIKSIAEEFIESYDCNVAENDMFQNLIRDYVDNNTEKLKKQYWNTISKFAENSQEWQTRLAEREALSKAENQTDAEDLEESNHR